MSQVITTLSNVIMQWRAMLRFHDRWLPVPTRSILNKIDRYSRTVENPYFIQIGANDGCNDQFHAFIERDHWQGILVEPQKVIFEERLCKTYGNHPSLILENVAISTRTGVRPLYKIAISSARWASGLSSFKRSTVEKHIDKGRVARKAGREGIALPSNRDDYITTEDVQCLTFDDLVKKHNVTRLDVVLIDAEGYDHEIVKMIDLEVHMPDLLVFEHKHLSTEDYKECCEHLRSNKYKLYSARADTMAVKMSINNRLRYA